MTPRDFLSQLTHIVLAVVDGAGKPWAVPVAVQKYENGSVEWLSKTNTVHSKAIANNPEVMLTAFTTKHQPQGEYAIYARARAKKTMPTPGVARYRAEIYELWYTDHRHRKIEVDVDGL